MNNQMILRTMYDRTIKMNELYHHGVEGMSWGDRNGPPYPLSGVNKKEARREAKAKIEKEKRLEKMRKAAAKKRKMQAKETKKQEKIDKMKLKLLREGNMDKINKKSKYFTNEELQFARERNREMIETRYAKNPNKAPDPHTMEKLMNVVDKVGKIATAAIPVVTLLKGAKELKNMGIDRELKIEKAMNEATESKIRLVKDFDPEAAARLAGDYTGTKVQHKPKKEEKKPGDIKTISEALSKIDKNAAAKYLSDVTGYDVNLSADSLINNPSYKGSKQVKGTIESLLGKSKKVKANTNGNGNGNGNNGAKQTEQNNAPYVGDYIQMSPKRATNKNTKWSFFEPQITEISGILGGNSKKKASEVASSSATSIGKKIIEEEWPRISALEQRKLEELLSR